MSIRSTAITMKIKVYLTFPDARTYRYYRESALFKQLLYYKRNSKLNMNQLFWPAAIAFSGGKITLGAEKQNFQPFYAHFKLQINFWVANLLFRLMDKKILGRFYNYI